MIVTHTQNANGQRRIYLGGKGSLECWIDPRSDGPGWTFHITEAVTGNPITPEDQRAWAIHTLLALADELHVSPPELATVPFESIAALHTDNPFKGRRVASPKNRHVSDCFMATAPHITRPAQDFEAPSDPETRRRR